MLNAAFPPRGFGITYANTEHDGGYQVFGTAPTPMRRFGLYGAT